MEIGATDTMEKAEMTENYNQKKYGKERELPLNLVTDK